MTACKMFIGEHSSVLINLDSIEFAECPDACGNEYIIHFRSGASITLTHGNARMFLAAWTEYNKLPN